MTISRLLLSVLFAGALLFPLVSHAAWNGGTIDYLRVNTTSSTAGRNTAGFAVKLVGYDCPGSPGGEFQTNPTQSGALDLTQVNRLIELLLQAKVNGHYVNIEHNYCAIRSITIH